MEAKLAFGSGLEVFALPHPTPIVMTNPLAVLPILFPARNLFFINPRPFIAGKRCAFSSLFDLFFDVFSLLLPRFYLISNLMIFFFSSCM